MWERLTPSDIQRAKSRLVLTRAETLNRHAEEIKSLDAQQDEVERLEQLVSSFAQKYLARDISTSGPPSSHEEPSEGLEEQPPPTAVGAEEPSAPSRPEVPHDADAPAIQVHQEVSPNFGIPLRRFVRN